MSLRLVGLGPSPELQDLTRRAELILRACQTVLLDSVTAGATARRQRALETLLGRPVELSGPLAGADREALLARAAHQDLALAVAGDPLLATPYCHLLRQARALGLEVEVVPGLNAWSAVACLAGLDVATTRPVLVQNPGAPTDAELAEIRVALQGGAAVVMAAGRQPEAPAALWAELKVLLEASHDARVEAIDIDGGGRSLVVTALEDE